MKKTMIYAVCSVAVFLIAYVALGFEMSDRAKKNVATGMQSSSDYTGYMTEEVYRKLLPTNRMPGYEESYVSANHAYKASVVPLHFFFAGQVKVKNVYDGKGIGFSEEVTLKLKWENGDWIATKVKIPA
ncbi:hypothetical protein RB620_12285 [Paenibacillus sp. LHD-117]|uniref:hypothetical protein n=1 Tax=Paenibacillus sp. LHD-117 TaxID=3071412 RepID=UPI0027DFE84B|nr:hypothetical protein [Paenibacillus sp. LHD-117]MDQ6420215.1 hypothetical protein [Paenibacillus sp. LHD-117]